MIPEIKRIRMIRGYDSEFIHDDMAHLLEWSLRDILVR